VHIKNSFISIRRFSRSVFNNDFYVSKVFLCLWLLIFILFYFIQLIFHVFSFVAVRSSRLENVVIRCSSLLFFPTNAIPCHWWREFFWCLLRQIIRQPLPDQERARTFWISRPSTPRSCHQAWSLVVDITWNVHWLAQEVVHEFLVSMVTDGPTKALSGSWYCAEWTHSNSRCSTVSSGYAQSVSLGPESAFLSMPRSHPAWFAELLQSRLSPVGRSNRWTSSSRPQCSSFSALTDRKIPRRYGRENQSGIRPYRRVDANRPEVPRDVASWPWPARLSPFSSPLPHEPGRRRTSHCLRSTLGASSCELG